MKVQSTNYDTEIKYPFTLLKYSNYAGCKNKSCYHKGLNYICEFPSIFPISPIMFIALTQKN